MIETRDLSVTIYGHPVLRDVDLMLPAGRMK